MRREWYAIAAHEQYVIDDEADSLADRLADIEEHCRRRLELLDGTLRAHEDRGR
jgi:hypothetical protein